MSTFSPHFSPPLPPPDPTDPSEPGHGWARAPQKTDASSVQEGTGGGELQRKRVVHSSHDVVRGCPNGGNSHIVSGTGRVVCVNT